MITIDIVDDNDGQSGKPVVGAYPVEKNRRNGMFDSAYESARGYHDDLLRTADQARQIMRSGNNRGNDTWHESGMILALNRIARALTAWL